MSHFDFFGQPIHKGDIIVRPVKYGSSSPEMVYAVVIGTSPRIRVRSWHFGTLAREADLQFPERAIIVPPHADVPKALKKALNEMEEKDE